MGGKDKLCVVGSSQKLKSLLMEALQKATNCSVCSASVPQIAIWGDAGQPCMLAKALETLFFGFSTSGEFPTCKTECGSHEGDMHVELLKVLVMRWKSRSRRGPHHCS